MNGHISRLDKETEWALSGAGRANRPAAIAALLFPLARGALLGNFAGVVQVVVSQIVGIATGRRERTDIAPRLVERAAERLGTSLSRAPRWTLVTAFHFGYATGWGVLFALVRESRRGRRVPTWLLGSVFGGAIDAVAFSRFGAGTRLGSELHPDRRERRELVLQWASALSFALVLASAEAWSRKEW